VIAVGITALVNRSLNRDFHREWVDSLRVRKKRPLGEEEIARLRK
jgi:putative membrane protein